MLLFLMCSLLVLEASNWHQYYDAALVTEVNTALTECSAAYEVFQNFVSESLDTNRRRDEDQFAELEGVMKTCGAILEAADIFHEDPHAFDNGRSFGLITLLSSEVTFLNAKLGDKSKEIGNILFVASRDGDAASDFHSACDDKGPTIVIIQTEFGAVFGGYTDKTWAGNGFVSSTDAFLFQLRPEMKHYAIVRSSQGLMSNDNWGPIFNDIEIFSEALSNKLSYVCGGGIYAASDGSYISDSQQYFQVADYAVLEAL